MTTQTSTASALARVNAGVASDAVHKHTSGPVLNDPIKTKATASLADQASHATANVTLTRDKVSYTGDAAKTNFAIPFAVRLRSDIVVTVNGTASTAFTWAADNSSITFTAAPAAAAAIVIADTPSALNIPDVKSALPAFTTTVTKVNS